MFFGGFKWYDCLDEPAADEPSAWGVVKGDPSELYARLLNAALGFARSHGLSATYRPRFGGLRSGDLTLNHAKRAGQTPSFPVWTIANELLAARYLERVLGWQLRKHEPGGRDTHRGEWEFNARHGGRVFVEVKSMREPLHVDRQGVSTATNDYTGRVSAAVGRAYRQLPTAEAATLVVLVGRSPLALVPGAPFLGDVVSAMFGRFQVSMNVMPYDPSSVKAGPSQREMFVQPKKNRKLGAVSALIPGGADEPALAFYTVHNPFANPSARLPSESLGSGKQLAFDERLNGRWLGQDDPAQSGRLVL